MPSANATLDDTALVQLALAGDGESFGELMHRHTKAIRARVESIIRNSSQVDDLVQDVFFKAWRALPQFRADASFRTWLTSIATNEALMCWRRERRHNWESPDAFDTLACHHEAADEAVIRREEERAIHRAIVKLPLKYREAVILHDLQELSLDVTATRLKSTVAAAKSRVFRARLKLATALRRSPMQTLRAA